MDQHTLFPGNSESTLLTLESSLYATSSVDSATTSNTVWGPGTLSGKALLAFGEAALRGIENIVIWRKLATIGSVLPHKDDAAIRNLDRVYDDLLELSRPRLYSEQVQHRAMRLILVQIGSRQTAQLLKSLAKWPNVELQLFLSEIMACMPDDWLMPRTPAKEKYSRLTDAFLTSQPGQNHAAIPMIDFVRQLVDRNQSTCPAVLDAGFVDMIFCIYALALSPQTLYADHSTLFMETAVATAVSRNPLLVACNLLLFSLLKHADGAWSLPRHPIHVFWPVVCPTPFIRLSVCRVLSPDTFGAYMADWVLARYLTHITCVSDKWKALVGRWGEYSAALDVFSRIVGSLVSTHSKIPTWQLPKTYGIDHFLQFAVIAAERNVSVSLALLNAGVLVLWFAVAKDELNSPSEFAVALKADKPYLSAPVADSELLHSVHEHGLAEFLIDGEFTHRRSVWCRLFKVLLELKLVAKSDGPH